MIRPSPREYSPVANDLWRPHYHFLPVANWINDPNGLIYWQGVYHLFYQYNPHGPFWGTIHWGHASSRDLVHWEHHPIALTPGPDRYDVDGCWSGCAVDADGTPMLFYTGKEQDREHVCLAQGDAQLQHWQKEPTNPLIAHPPVELDTLGFRDPFVWREDDSWWMLMGSGLRGQGGSVLLYTSQDLHHWDYQRPLLTGDGTTGTLWECPNFFRLGEQALLIVSVLPLERVLAFVGNYQQGTFLPDHHFLLDGGSCYYAPQVMQGTGKRRLLFGWLKEEQEHASTWAGAIALPRHLSLHEDGGIRMQPIAELEQLRYHPRSSSWTLSPGESHPITINQQGQWECEARLTPARDGHLTLNIADDTQTYATLSFDLAAQRCRLEAPGETPEQWLEYHMPSDDALHLQCFFDHSILEIFVQQERCLTKRIYPTSLATTHLVLSLQGPTAISTQLQTWNMHDAEFHRADQQNGN